MKDPQRLRELTDLPSELQDALRGLARNAPPADAVTRIQRSLSTLPQPPGPAGGLTSGASAGTYVSVSALAAVAVAVAAGAVWIHGRFVQPHDTANPIAPSVAEAPAALLVPPPTAAPVSDTSTRTAAAPAPLPAAAPSDTAPIPEPQGGLREHTAPRPSRRKASAIAASEVTAAPASQVEPLTAAETPVLGLEPKATTARTRPSVAAPEDEASLLYRAKQSARTNQQAAFRLLGLHAQYFPDGALVEEREVLAIDLLRRMGRDSEARARAGHFLERFPNSSYRSALAR